MLDSHFAAYYLEMLNLSVLSRPEGFVCYRVESDHVFLGEIYVRPDFRRTGAGTALVNDLIAVTRREQRDHIRAAIFNRKGMHGTIAAALTVGFEIDHVDPKGAVILALHLPKEGA